MPAPIGVAAGDPVDGIDAGTRGARPRQREPRTDWRLGGRSVRRWRESLLAVALIVLALLMLASPVLEWLWPSPVSALVSTAVIWVGSAAVVVFALLRSRPVGLFRFRALDLLYGVALGLVLRTMQGWIEGGERGTAAFPSFALIDGRLGMEWWLIDGAGAVIIAPAVEELFFRGVILVALYTMLRRPFGRSTAAWASVLASTGLFVLAHALAFGSDLSGVLTLLLLAIVCGCLVVLTGRIWGAIFVHVSFNASFVVLGVIGTFWT